MEHVRQAQQIKQRVDRCQYSSLHILDYRHRRRDVEFILAVRYYPGTEVVWEHQFHLTAGEAQDIVNAGIAEFW